ncbi:Uncharacterised protein [Mycobacteroides abscessus subsp. abscessus]|nr:Uncharacterised protein [Mycobacteroides abscessus subsp. abscessus]
MPNGPPNPWSESNSPSLRQNQGGSFRAVQEAKQRLSELVDSGVSNS